MKGVMLVDKVNNYTVNETAEILKLKVRTVREMIHTDRIKAFKYPGGKAWMIPETEIKRLSDADKG